jgi:hypothetical protein
MVWALEIGGFSGRLEEETGAFSLGAIALAG